MQYRFLLDRLVLRNAIATMSFRQNLLQRSLFLVRRLGHRLLVLELAPRPQESLNVGRIVVFLLFAHFLRFRRLEHRFAIGVVSGLQIADKRFAVGHRSVNRRVQGEAVRVKRTSLILKVERRNVRILHESG